MLLGYKERIFKMIKPTKRKVAKKAKRKNPDLHNFIKYSLEKIDQTRKNLNKSEKYLSEIANSIEFTNEDLRKFNDIEYWGDNPLYELYQDYNTLSGESRRTVERTEDIIEMINNFNLGKPKKSFSRRY
jgi:hypothetical protein